MTLERSLVVLSAVICAGIGLYVMVAPERAVGAVGIALDNDPARIDVTATYGGMCVGLAGWFAACLRPERLWLGLVGVLGVFGGLALGRLVAIARGAQPDALLWAFLAIEVAFAGVAAWRLARGRPGSMGEGP
jgi:hypothetical protein